MCEETKPVRVFGHVANDLDTEYWDRAGWVWHEVQVDGCVAGIVEELNEQAIYTLASCCGHGDKGGIAILEEDASRVAGMGYGVGVGPDGWPWAVQV